MNESQTVCFVKPRIRRKSKIPTKMDNTKSQFMKNRNNLLPINNPNNNINIKPRPSQSVFRGGVSQLNFLGRRRTSSYPSKSS